MLHRIENNLGFDTTIIDSSDSPLSIGIIDADLFDHGTRHPNLALLKISGYCKSRNHKVRLVEDYSELNIIDIEHNCSYDILVMSKVFKFTNIPDYVQEMIDNHIMMKF
jgi:hypothetical protein